MQRSIAIIGAGPAGLAFARILSQNKITSTIFELDASPETRSQFGGLLDLHAESGQRALAAAGLTDEFNKIVSPGGEMMRLADKTGFLHIDQADPGNGRPEVDRAKLRRMLIESLPPTCIRWGSKVASVTPHGDKFDISLADGSTVAGFDLVVGADGTWSRVRPLVTDVEPIYSGISCIEFRTSQIASRYPGVASLVGTGSYFSASDYNVLIAQRQGDGNLRTYAMVRVPETWLDDRRFEFPKDKTRLVEEKYADWSDELKSLILLSDDEGTVQRKLMMLPVGLTWDSRPGVALIGDAAHVMTPFAGEGVNAALMDAMDLAEKIVKSDGNYSAAVRQYDEAMLLRARETAERTVAGMKVMFHEETAEAFKEFMLNLGSQ